MYACKELAQLSTSRILCEARHKRLNQKGAGITPAPFQTGKIRSQWSSSVSVGAVVTIVVGLGSVFSIVVRLGAVGSIGGLGFRSGTTASANLLGSTHWAAPTWMRLAREPNKSVFDA